MRVSHLTNDGSPKLRQSTEAKMVHKTVPLYKMYLLASGKVDWTSRSI
jgi:hypothetical protein